MNHVWERFPFDIIYTKFEFVINQNVSIFQASPSHQVHLKYDTISHVNRFFRNSSMRWSILLVLICNKNSNSEKWSYYDISTTYYLLPPFLFKIWKGWDVWMWVGFSRDDFEFANSCTFSTRHRFLLQTCSNIVTLILGCSSLRPTTNRSLSFYCDNIVVQRRLERNILTVRSS